MSEIDKLLDDIEVLRERKNKISEFLDILRLGTEYVYPNDQARDKHTEYILMWHKVHSVPLPANFFLTQQMQVEMQKQFNFFSLARWCI